MRAVPVRFLAAPSLKKPGIKADAQRQAHYRQQHQQHNLSQQAVGLLTGRRLSLEQAGVSQKTLLVAGDGNFCHRALYRTPLEHMDLLCRTRADLRLCRPAPAGSHRPYDPQKFTPEHVRQSEVVL